MKSQYLVACMITCLLAVPYVWAQRSTGDIEGTTVDSTGASIPNVRVTISDQATGFSRTAATDATGYFQVLDLQPSNYTVTAQVSGFRLTKLTNVVVRLGSSTPVAIKMEVGEVKEVVEVSASEVAVDTSSTQVEGVISTRQIEQLAIIGRNVMDLAQLEPGVQIRDGGDVDPTKNNFSVVSVQGRGGRETQIQWDGLSIEDYSVGGAVVNVSLDAIEEFQVAQAALDPSHSVASGGAVNIISRRGGNQFHGSAYEFFRNDALGSAIGGIKAPFQRNQFGARFGGPLIRNRLFISTNFERAMTDDSFVGSPASFPQYHKVFPKPFRDTFSVGRLDWTISPAWTAFGRFSYSKNNGLVGNPVLGGSFLNGFNNRTQSNVLGAGLSYAMGNWTHQFLFGHVAFSEAITKSSVIPTPLDSQGRPFSLLIDGGSSLALGPNLLSDQLEGQRTWQGKYDGSYIWKNHTFRFGGDFVRWVTLGDFPLLINGPQLNTSSALSTSTDPLDYPLLFVLFGNAQGYLSEKPALGKPHGGTFQFRPAFYIHDTWRVKRGLSLNYGLRWFWMSDIVNPDLKRSPLLDDFRPGLSAPRKTSKANFSPQFGIAWDPKGDGKTVIRSAVGLQYLETTVDVGGIDRAPFIPAGIALNFGFIAGGVPLVDPRTGNAFPAGDSLATSFGFPNGTSASELAPLFEQPIGSVATQVNDLNGLFQAAAALAAQAPNQPSNFDLLREISFVRDFTLAWGPHPKVPRTFQFTVGVEHELRKGLVVGADYVFARDLDFPLYTDWNKVGKASAATFDVSTAQAAITAANAAFGCPADTLSASIDCAITAGAQIRDYGANGLGAGAGFQGFAFRGLNPNFSILDFIDSNSTSDYNALNLRLQGKLGKVKTGPFRWMKSNYLTGTYTLSSKVGEVRPGSLIGVADQSFFPAAWDNDRPSAFRGPFGLDRRHQMNWSTITEVPGGFRFSTIWHWFGKFPQSPTLPQAFNGCDAGPAEIFCTDFTGDGTVGDLLPTARHPGSYGRDLGGVGALNQTIASYNSQYAGKFTPAGQLLVDNGLFSSAQLQALGGVMPTLSPAPSGAVGIDPLFTVDLRVSWSHTFKDRVTIEPVLDVFNVMNRTNYDPPGNVLAGDLTGTAGHINGTTALTRTNFRQRGSGTFEQGANRQIQLGIRITF